jgi:hypothetical protein
MSQARSIEQRIRVAHAEANSLSQTRCSIADRGRPTVRGQPNTARSRRPSKLLDAFCRRQFAADCVIGTFGFDFRQRQLSFAERGLSDWRPFPFGRLKPLRALIINPFARALLASAERNERGPAEPRRHALPSSARRCSGLRASVSALRFCRHFLGRFFHGSFLRRRFLGGRLLGRRFFGRGLFCRCGF